MLAFLFILVFVAGAVFGVLTMALMMASGRNEEAEDRNSKEFFCKDCVYSNPSDENYCYWCDIQNCDVWGMTEACSHFTDLKRETK